MERSLDAWEGRDNPWDFWPPKQKENPRRTVLSRAIEDRSAALAAKLPTAGFDDEQLAYAHLALAIVADETARLERIIGDLRAHGYRPWKIDHSAAVYRRFAAGETRVTSMLTPLVDGDDLGPWPHLLWT